MTDRLVTMIIAIFVLMLSGCAVQLSENDGGMPKNNTGIPENNADSVENYEVIVDDLDTPWEIDFLPDGRMIFTERPGRISIVEEGLRTTIAEIGVSEMSESGLLGLALDPDFEDNSYVYIYYTSEQDNRISRFVLEDMLTVNQLTNETVLLDDIPNALFHDGGRIAFGPDEKLYVTTGDATEPSSAQNIDSLAGKILRMNKDGSVPEDNPFGNYVYSYGHRNPQGLAWKNNVLFSSEHGPNMHDEINIIERGGNYGWPKTCSEEGDYIRPIRCFDDFTLAPGGIVFFEGNLYVTGLRGNQLRRLELDESNNIIEEKILIDDLGRLRAVAQHNGSLYISTSNRDKRGFPSLDDDRILRISMDDIG